MNDRNKFKTPGHLREREDTT